MHPMNVFSAWPKELFHSKNIDQLINQITNGSVISQSENIHIKAPEIAENGAVVPISVNSDLPNVNRISILVENNPSPLTSSFDINSQLEAYVSTRVKIAESSNIIAIISTSDNQFFTASRSIKVTIGGCGG